MSYISNNKTGTTHQSIPAHLVVGSKVTVYDQRDNAWKNGQITKVVRGTNGQLLATVKLDVTGDSITESHQQVLPRAK
ncbi:hypothetical protein AURDEDRAFT_162233 [Auricularia subglabra TFB-10046 SS5]|nr:hypothetical protein AURDEDRAFT_162233 [Auricularia subglabra TFB-10046 SS5]